MTRIEARPTRTDVHVLAEGPVWDATTGLVHWVDVEVGDVLTGRLTADDVVAGRRVHVDTTVGAVLPGPDGRLVVAGRSALLVLEADGTVRPGAELLPPAAGRRLNDAACDPAGRVLVGSLSLEDDTGPDATGHECLWRVEDDGSVTVLDADLGLSNGLAWSADGGTLYSVDTLPGVVWARDYDPVTGAVGPRRVHLSADVLRRAGDGHPDGLCADADGNLWVALWGAGAVACFAPDGVVRHVVDVPAPHTSSVALVGPELGTLLVTTASRDLDAPGRARHPDAGRLFTADASPLGVRGVPTTPWNGHGVPTARS